MDNIKIGQVIEMGSYPQNEPEKAEPIAWKVLAVEDGKALLITETGIDNVSYHNGNMNVTWEICDLRKWLNGQFFEKAFTKEEAEKIVLTKLINSGSKVHGAKGGKDTEDKIFALSIDEALKYMPTEESRTAKASELAKKKGAFVESVTGNCWYWLRSPGYYQSDAAGINYIGYMHASGDNVSSPSDTVRPAMWIQL